MDAVTAFIMDDHEVVRQGVRTLLESTGEIQVVGEASTAEEAMRRLPALRPDVAVLDIRVPDGNGIEVCREIRSTLGTQCLILTSCTDDEALLESTIAGASGYVLKQVRGNELIDSVKRVAAGESLLDPAIVERMRGRLREQHRGDEMLDSLTTREREILRLIADGRTNRQIGDELFLAEKTIKNYVSNMLAKLGMQHRTEAAVFATRLEMRSRPVEPEPFELTGDRP